MFYLINKEIELINIDQIGEEGLIIGYMSLDEFEQCYQQLGFHEASYNECVNHGTNFRNSVDVYDDYTFGLLNVLNLHDVFGSRDMLGFFIKKNLFLVVDVVDEDKSTFDVFRQAVYRYKPENVTQEKLIYGFLERLIYNDSKTLENIEINISELEDRIHEEDIDKSFVGEILVMKKELILIRNYYEQFVTIGEELGENENDIFREEDLRYFKLFTDKATRLSSNASMLRDNVVQLREAYDAILDYNLNSIMKVFTVVTTIFLPLTLVVGWYGMNFTTMPELAWKYGYIGVIVFSVLVVIGCIIFFKKKKLL